uniref:Uncharacterized protein LOC117346364 isoform X2 n=1 Tax=Geotrypetes seraphini TaxID=260995 RepID=A0A6P8P857_GEOSA|nr:uncharacterized protein LOC117346364 isoform X2 [Geotrypetes seraphini]
MNINNPDFKKKTSEADEVPREGTDSKKVLTEASNKEPQKDQAAEKEKVLLKAKEMEEKEKKKKSEKCHNTEKEVSSPMGEHSKHSHEVVRKKWRLFPFHTKKRVKENDVVSVYHSAESVASTIYDDALSQSSSKESVEEIVVTSHTIFSYLGITKPTTTIIKKEDGKRKKKQPEDSASGIPEEQRAENVDPQKRSGEP